MSATVRVELHGVRHEEQPYQTLHRAMEQQGFSRQVVADGGARFWLPPAEYRYEGAVSLNQVRELAKAAAGQTGRSYTILATEGTWAGYQLTPVR
jgi:hypothetical protein